MSAKGWAHLPNAAHIDHILAHLRAHPERWGAARGAAGNAAWDAARNAAWDAVWNAAWDAVWNAARDAPRDAAWNAPSDAAWNALLALIAYDDCAHILDMPSGAVRLLVSIDHPAAALLYPAVLAMKE